MNALQIIAKRRAVREFASKALSREEARSLIDAAVLAPSARNVQPWSFAILLGQDHVDGLADRAQNWILRQSPPQDVLNMIRAPNFSLFYHAPALALILATDRSTQSTEDCCLAAQNFMLAARAQAFGTCWIGLARPWLDLPQTKAELGLPEHYRVVAPIVFGHPLIWPKATERRAPQIQWLGT